MREAPGCTIFAVGFRVCALRGTSKLRYKQATDDKLANRTAHKKLAACGPSCLRDSRSSVYGLGMRVGTTPPFE